MKIVYAYQTINNYKRSLKPFYIAIQWIVFEESLTFNLKAVLDDDTVPKTVLTEEQEKHLATAKLIKPTAKSMSILILLKNRSSYFRVWWLALSNLDFENRVLI